MALSLASVQLNLAVRARRGLWAAPPVGPADTPVRTEAPGLTLPEVLTGIRDVLPGARVRRHQFWRYSLVWHAPR